MNPNFQSPRSRLPALVWLSRILETDARKRVRLPDSVLLAQVADKLSVPPAAERARQGMASLDRQPQWSGKPRYGEDPVRPGVNWPLSFPESTPALGERAVVKDAHHGRRGNVDPAEAGPGWPPRKNQR